MSLVKEKLQGRIKPILEKELGGQTKEQIELIRERYKYLDEKLRDEVLNKVAVEYYLELDVGEDQQTVINSFIAGALYEKWRAAIEKHAQ
jgi:hypothetical protein